MYETLRYYIVYETLRYYIVYETLRYYVHTYLAGLLRKHEPRVI